MGVPIAFWDYPCYACPMADQFSFLGGILPIFIPDNASRYRPSTTSGSLCPECKDGDCPKSPKTSGHMDEYIARKSKCKRAAKSGK